MGQRATITAGQNQSFWGKCKTVLDNIRFEHTIFALPFAYLGMVLAVGGWPGFAKIFWVTLAMAGARTLAMSLNRLIDRHIDARNPRTVGRPLPSGRLSARDVSIACLVSFLVMMTAAFFLNWLCVILLPVAVFFFVLYSYTKRFTWLCHLVLGICTGAAPVGAWVAMKGNLNDPLPWFLWLAVGSWIGGFDIIYACQDVDFDRTNSLKSLPARFGIGPALIISLIAHLFTMGAFITAGFLAHLSWYYWIGVAGAFVILAYEHSIVRPNDLSRINVAFFNLNSYVSLIIFSFTVLAVWLG